jgi:hypothetical protein
VVWTGGSPCQPSNGAAKAELDGGGLVLGVGSGVSSGRCLDEEEMGRGGALWMTASSDRSCRWRRRWGLKRAGQNRRNPYGGGAQREGRSVVMSSSVPVAGAQTRRGRGRGGSVRLA